MYTKDLGERITLRLDPVLREHILKMCDVFGCTPSEYIRQTLNQARWSYERAFQTLDSSLQKISEVDCNDNKTDKHNQL